MLTYKEVIKKLRTLAKNNYWQTLYAQGKETPGIRLFGNHNDFTNLQVSFLNNLSFYSTLYLDIALGEVEEIVMNNDIYEDAYSYWKSKSRIDKNPIPTTNNKKVAKENNLVEKDEWIFNKPKKKV